MIIYHSNYDRFAQLDSKMSRQLVLGLNSLDSEISAQLLQWLTCVQEEIYRDALSLNLISGSETVTET